MDFLQQQGIEVKVIPGSTSSPQLMLSLVSGIKEYLLIGFCTVQELPRLLELQLSLESH